MNYYIGQIFNGYPPLKAIDWINKNNCKLQKNGSIYTIVENPKYIPTKADLSEFGYQEKCKVAYGGVTVKKDDNEYTFETTQDSITMCNSRAFAIVDKPDDFIITWKVWQGDIPTVINITKAEFLSIFAFGSNMIDEAFTIEGTLNNTINQLTVELLTDTDYINKFKEYVVECFNTVNTHYDLAV